ncbi:hypothetical protein CCR95_21885 [Thiocystis minor]|uniref:hypothetical protein n=1 Tax=Thiocystis minor TaxID=61597 RepID=UPI001914CE2E|nr:hypothetical protein [Thiocystis minor]MBK5966652.1 hypothetical protein [Thiocystis minor]
MYYLPAPETEAEANAWLRRFLIHDKRMPVRPRSSPAGPSMSCASEWICCAASGSCCTATRFFKSWSAGRRARALAGGLEGRMIAEEARSIDRRLADDDGPHPITEGARD